MVTGWRVGRRPAHTYEHSVARRMSRFLDGLGSASTVQGHSRWWERSPQKIWPQLVMKNRRPLPSSVMPWNSQPLLLDLHHADLLTISGRRQTRGRPSCVGQLDSRRRVDLFSQLRSDEVVGYMALPWLSLDGGGMSRQVRKVVSTASHCGCEGGRCSRCDGGARVLGKRCGNERTQRFAQE